MTLDHHAVDRVAGSRVAIPTRSLLLLYKAKAAWDRGYRITHGPSTDPAWETAKRTKDRADLLALTDERRIAEGWDLGFLRAQLDRIPCLVEVPQDAAEDPAARERYRGIQARLAREHVDQLLRLLGFEP